MVCVSSVWPGAVWPGAVWPGAVWPGAVWPGAGPGAVLAEARPVAGVLLWPE